MNRVFIRGTFAAMLLAAFCAPAVSAQDTSAKFIRTSNSQSFDNDFTVAAEKTVNAVVCIKSFASQPQRGYSSQGYDPFDMFDFFFGSPMPRQQQPRRQQPGKNEPVQTGLGSGVIITDDGYIVTNNHVIDGADKLEVLLNDNSTLEARIIGTDEATDLALIKIDANGLSPISFGDSDNLKVGEWVLAVGNPFGFNSTVTAGIVSAKARSLGQGGSNGKMGIESFIQTDAALNPGNSGGALVNLKGELVGINSAIYSNTGTYAGFSFAIPTTIVKKVITDIRQSGTVQRAVLGCTVANLDAKIAKDKNITAVKAGVIVATVSDRSTAKEIGLQENDVITAINGVEVHTISELSEQMSKYRPGDTISLTFYRDNKKHTKTATLRNTQGNTNVTKKTDFSEAGCIFMKASESTLQSLGLSNGVQVVEVNPGPFKDSNMKAGFVITEVNNQIVKTPEDIEDIYNRVIKGDGDKLLIIQGVYPTGKKHYFAVNLEE